MARQNLKRRVKALAKRIAAAPSPELEAELARLRERMVQK